MNCIIADTFLAVANIALWVAFWRCRPQLFLQKLRVALCLSYYVGLLMITQEFYNTRTFDVCCILPPCWHWKLCQYLALDRFSCNSTGRGETPGGNLSRGECPTPVSRRRLVSCALQCRYSYLDCHRVTFANRLRRHTVCTRPICLAPYSPGIQGLPKTKTLFILRLLSQMYTDFNHFLLLQRKIHSA